MHPNPSQSRNCGRRLAAHAGLVSALVALATFAAPSRSLAQAPTFNTLVTTYKGNPSYAHPTRAAVGDFNGDGKLDSVVVDGTATLRVMLGQGNGSFAEHDVGIPNLGASNHPVVDLPASLASYLPKSIDGFNRLAAADVNGDGKLDLVCETGAHINFGPYNFVTVLINTGNDSSGVPQFSVTSYYSVITDQRSIMLGDLNGDGRPDILTGMAYGAIMCWMNNGDGTFTYKNYTNMVPSGGAIGTGAIADVNGDGKADCVVAANQVGETEVFYGNGDGTFQPTPLLIPNGAQSLVLADLNKDGKPDLVEVDGANVLVYLNSGGGTFGAAAVYPLSGTGVVTTADMNGDGNLDVLVGLPSANKAAILLGDGTGALGASNLYGVNNNPQDIATGDFNGDGKPDIGTVGYNDDTYGVLTNTTPAPLPTQTLTILGGNGTVGGIAANVEYYNPATSSWQSAYLVGTHPWGEITGTNSWINYKPSNSSDPGAGPTTNQTLWYLYRVRFTVPSDAVNPKMTFSVKADNFAQVAINGTTTGGSTQYIDYAYVNNVIVGQADQLNADAAFSQAVHTGENTITINVGDWGGLNGFNFRIDLSMQSSQSLQVVPTAQPPVVTSATVSQGYGTSFSYTIAATNSPTGYSATNLPAGLTLSGNTISGMLPNTVGTFNIGLSATNAGGTGTGTLSLSIVDTVPPVIAAPTSVTAEATGPSGAAVSFTATASDVISGNVSVTATPASGSTFPIGITGVTLSAKDAAGNTATQPLVVHVQDTTAPTLSVPANQTLEATSVSGAVATFSATATDVVGVTSLTYSAASGGTFPLGVTTVTVTAADAAGNKSTDSFTITVRDTTPPALTVPASQTLEATGPGGAVAMFSATATDAVTAAPTISYTVNGLPVASGSTFPLGVSTVTVTAADAAGNKSTGSFSVTVQDTTPPTITSIPANITAEATSAAGALVSYAAATATDLVTSNPAIAYSQASGTTFPIGTTTVTVTATDAAGNASTKSFTVTVRDTTAPVIASVTPSSATLWPPNHQMVAIAVKVVASDNTGVASAKILNVTSSEPDNGLGDGDTPNDIQVTGDLTVNLRAERSGTGSGRTYTITVEVRDAYGNASQKSCTVFVPKSQGGK